MISDIKEGGHEFIPESEATSQQLIDHACNQCVEEYGQVYLDQVFRAVVQQVNKIEAAHGQKPRVEEVRKFLTQANYKHPTKKKALQTIIFYKGIPLVEVEFSDYFYVKLVQLVKQ